MFGPVRSRYPSRQAQRGAELVEVLLGLALFLGLMFTFLQGTQLVSAYNMTAYLASEGARYAAVRGTGAAAEAGRKDVVPATESTITAFVKGIGLLDASKTTVTAIWDPAGNKNPGSRVTVTVSYAFDPISSPLVWLTSRTVSSSARTTVLY